MPRGALIDRKPVALGAGLPRVEKDWRPLLANAEQTFLTDNQLSAFVDSSRPGCERLHFYPLPFPHRFRSGRFDVWELTKYDSLRTTGPYLDVTPETTRLQFLPHRITKSMTAGPARIEERCAVWGSCLAIEWEVEGRSELVLALSLPHYGGTIRELPDGIQIGVEGQVFLTLRLLGASELALSGKPAEPLEVKASLRLHPGRKIQLLVSCSYEEALPDVEPERVFREAEMLWDEYFTRVVPHFECSERDLERLYYYQAWVTRANLYDIPYEPFTHPYTCPWKTGALWQWSWNTPVAAIQERWFNDRTMGESGILLEKANGGALNIGSYLHPTAKQTAFRSHNQQALAAARYKKEGIPEGFSLEAFTTMPHTTPNGLLGVWELYLATGNKAWLREAVQVMVEAEAAFSSHDVGNGLCTCMFVDDFDYSLRWKPFSSSYKPASYDWELDTPVMAIDYNCYLHSLRERLVEAACEAGVEIDAVALRRRNELLKASINERLWDEASGFYYDADPRTMKRSSIKSIAAFSALYAGIADRAQAARLVEHLQNPAEFATPYPCPSLSMDSPAEDPADFRIGGGSLTTTGTWFTVEGLMRYGYRELAMRYVLKTVQMMTKDGKISAADWYHTGTGASNRTHNELAQQGLIVADLICRYIIGIHPRPGQTFEVNPLALEGSGVERFVFGPYRFCDRRITVTFDRGEGYRLRVQPW